MGEKTRAETFAAIKKALDEYVMPQLLQDGGGVEAEGMKDDETVLISYQGACACCPMALTGTLSFIQEVLREHVSPEIKVIPCFSSQGSDDFR